MEMSTNLFLPDKFELAVDAIPNTPTRVSFGGLIDRLESLSAVPALDDLQSWLSTAELLKDELLPFRVFKAGTYARHRIFRNDHAELLILCWRSGQKTPIHDHNGSIGAVRVFEGVLWETMFRLNDEHSLFYQSSREWHPGAVTGADRPDIHQLGNPDCSGQDLVTFHIYAPPLGVLNTYKVGSAEVGHYSPEQFTDGAGI
jgi:cysteine dioxygenase